MSFNGVRGSCPVDADLRRWTNRDGWSSMSDGNGLSLAGVCGCFSVFWLVGVFLFWLADVVLTVICADSDDVCDVSSEFSLAVDSFSIRLLLAAVCFSIFWTDDDCFSDTLGVDELCVSMAWLVDVCCFSILEFDESCLSVFWLVDVVLTVLCADVDDDVCDVVAMASLLVLVGVLLWLWRFYEYKR